MISLISSKDNRLKQISELVTPDEDIYGLAMSMRDLMIANKGVGLAAPQVGINKQIIVVKYANTDIVMLNPVITKHKNTKLVTSIDEGCLSFPNKRVNITRYKRVIVSGFDLQFKPLQIDARNFLAFIFQHEVDHLHGITII